MITFNQFWELYGNKKAKKAALRAWNKLKPEQHQEIMNHLPFRLDDIQWKRGFQPHAATFLNGELWEDEYETSQRDNKPSSYERLQSLS